jgi:hypothetical protein
VGTQQLSGNPVAFWLFILPAPPLGLQKGLVEGGGSLYRRVDRIVLLEGVGFGPRLLLARREGVRSIFLPVDRSKNKIHKPRVLFCTDVCYKKYVFMYY